MDLFELGPRPIAGRALDERGLGDFEAEVSRGSPASSSTARTSVLTPPLESCLPERFTHVMNGSRNRPSRRQPAVCATRRAQDELAEREDQVAALGDGDELSRA